MGQRQVMKSLENPVDPFATFTFIELRRIQIFCLVLVCASTISNADNLLFSNFMIRLCLHKQRRLYLDGLERCRMIQSIRFYCSISSNSTKVLLM